jgi:hypothetical protein
VARHHGGAGLLDLAAYRGAESDQPNLAAAGRGGPLAFGGKRNQPQTIGLQPPSDIVSYDTCYLVSFHGLLKIVRDIPMTAMGRRCRRAWSPRRFCRSGALAERTAQIRYQAHRTRAGSPLRGSSSPHRQRPRLVPADRYCAGIERLAVQLLLDNDVTHCRSGSGAAPALLARCEPDPCWSMHCDTAKQGLSPDDPKGL